MPRAPKTKLADYTEKSATVQALDAKDKGYYFGTTFDFEDANAILEAYGRATNTVVPFASANRSAIALYIIAKFVNADK